MLSKSATMMLGLINKQPQNAYEIVKVLEFVNIKWWYNIADSTVYATLRTLENKGLITGVAEKNGNMPFRTIYSISDKGRTELKDTLVRSIVTFDYDTNVFSIAAFFIDFFEADEQVELLSKRVELIQKYRNGIEKQISKQWEDTVPPHHIALVKRMSDLASAELSGAKRLLETLQTE